MSKTIGRFTHALYGGPETHTFPVVVIRLKRWSEDEKGNVSISPHLMTLREIDDYYDNLIRDLEADRPRAKRDLAAKLPNWMLPEGSPSGI